MRSVAFAALLVLLAGCLEDQAPTGATPPAGSPPGGASPTPTPATPALIENLTFRSLEHGTMLESGERALLVLNDSASWNAFYQEHAKEILEGDTGGPRNETTPEVDFSTERAVAVLMGEMPSGCYHIRVMEVTREAGETVVHVTSFTPSAEMACIAVVTQPYHYVAIPRLDGAVRFEEREVAGAPGA